MITKREPIKLPPGLRVGMRIATNARYRKVYIRSKPSRGVIVNGSKTGQVLVHLETHKTPQMLSPLLFDVIPSV